jgi:protein-tyrosine phosphatase
MIDIHSHILPGADHGCQSVGEGLSIIKEMSEMGFSDIVLTPHYDMRIDRLPLADLIKLFEAFKQELARRSAAANLFLGTENALCTELLNAGTDSPFTFSIKGKRYQLVEVHPLLHPAALDSYAEWAKRNSITPVIAHVERITKIVNDVSRIKTLKEKNFMFQVDLASFSSAADREFTNNSMALAEQGDIDLCATDCHSYRQLDIIKEGLIRLKSLRADWSKLFEL